MNLFGNFETLLHSRFPQLELVVRNFARPCDAVDNRQRPSNYTTIDDPLKVFGPDTFLCFFGFNESFAGAAGDGPLSRGVRQVSRRNGQALCPRRWQRAPRFVLISPIAWEPTGNPLWPDASERNATCAATRKSSAEVARERGLAFVDLFTPTEDTVCARARHAVSRSTAAI